MRLTQFTAADRVRAFGHVIIAGIYFYIAQSISVHAANGLASGAWAPLVERSILLFLLVVGFAAMGRAFNRQRQPIRDMGLVFRFAERITVLVGGRFLVEGTPAEIAADSRVKEVYLGEAQHD